MTTVALYFAAAGLAAALVRSFVVSVGGIVGVRSDVDLPMTSLGTSVTTALNSFSCSSDTHYRFALFAACYRRRCSHPMILTRQSHGSFPNLPLLPCAGCGALGVGSVAITPHQLPDAAACAGWH